MAPRPHSGLPTLRDLLARVHLRLILFAVVLAAASLMVSGVLVIRNYAQRNLELIARTTASPRSTLRPWTATCAPSAPHVMAAWRPMPEVEPVIRTVSPSSRPTRPTYAGAVRRVKPVRRF